MHRLLTRSLFAMLAAALCWAQALADPVPAPQPTASPVPPPVTVNGVVSGFTLSSDNPNATGALDTPSGADLSSRTQLSNALLTIAGGSGKFHFTVVAGAYAFPVVGAAINPTFQKFTNTNLYGSVPNAYAQYLPGSQWTISAGLLPTLLGQENAFTFQNPDIQRGLVWNMEPVVSRGVRVAYTGKTLSAALEYNDGFYTNNHGAIEGMLGWNPTTSNSLQFIFILPDVNAPPNTTVVVANKREYDLMYTQQIGKLQLLPYALWVVSPASTQLGYARSENAFGGVMMANYAFNAAISLGGRFEYAADGSALTDFGFNSDFVGYGPGSSATTFTLTPAYKTQHVIARAEWSHVTVYNALQGFGFGPAGTRTNQTRLGFELGLQF
jgi:hypothetical protein